jgi:tRNA-dihydrouridine synthase B
MKDVRRRVSETNVAGVLLGRAAQGNPWIFRTKDDVKHALLANDLPSISDEAISLKERFEVILEHSNHFETYCGRSRFNAIRKHLIWYCRGFRGAAEMRATMVRVNSSADVATCLRNFTASPRAECELSALAAPDVSPEHIPTTHSLEQSAS